MAGLRHGVRTGAESWLAELRPSRSRPSPRVHLAHAVVQRIAEEAGLRLLHLKGPALLPGLRAARHGSADVDVLVQPERLPTVRGRPAARGWDAKLARWTRARPSSTPPTGGIPHWGYADLHARWPGATDGAAEAVRGARRGGFDLQIAHVPCARARAGRRRSWSCCCTPPGPRGTRRRARLAEPDRRAAAPVGARSRGSAPRSRWRPPWATGGAPRGPELRSSGTTTARAAPTDRVAGPLSRPPRPGARGSGSPGPLSRQPRPPGDPAGPPALGGGAPAGACDPDHHAAARAGGACAVGGRVTSPAEAFLRGSVRRLGGRRDRRLRA